MKKKTIRCFLEVFGTIALICISSVTTYFLTIKYTVVTDNEKRLFLDEDNVFKPTKFSYKGKDYFYTDKNRNTQFYENTKTSDVVGFIIDKSYYEIIKEKFPNDYKNYEYETDFYLYGSRPYTYTILKLTDFDTSDRLVVQFNSNTLNVYIS